MMDGMVSTPQGLAALEAQVRRDIALTAHPRTDWMVTRLRDGKRCSTC